MRIEDEELRDLFKTTSEERLQIIDGSLLHLEKHPEDYQAIETILREAHSLKGDSNMLGLQDLGTLAHEIEHLLGDIKRGNQTFTPELCDRLTQCMDTVRKMVHEAVTGEPVGIDPFHALAQLLQAESSPAIAPISPIVLPDPEPVPQPIVTVEPVLDAEGIEEPETPVDAIAASPVTVNSAVAVVMPPPIPVASSIHNSQVARSIESVSTPPSCSIPDSTYRIETVRVSTQNLDALVTQAGELTVTKIRVAHRLAEIEAIANLWEEWSRDLFVNRSLFDEAQQRKTPQTLQAFYTRAETYSEQLGQLVNQLRSTFYEDTARLETLSDELEDGIRTLRLLPLSTLFNLFPRLVRDLARQEGKTVELILEGGETRADKRILEEMKDPLMHMIRNAIDHGIETPEERQQLGKPAIATLRIRGYQTPNSVVLEVTDDGRGLNINAIKETALRRRLYRADELEAMTVNQLQALILSPGFSTRTLVTEISGRGVGLDVLRTNVERLKGNIEVISTPGEGCTLRIHLSTTLGTAHVLVVAVQETRYALPVESVQTACLVKLEDIFTIEGRDTIIYKNEPVSVAWLADLLELDADHRTRSRLSSASTLSCVILKVGTEQLGLFVDALVDEQDVVLKPQSQLLKRIRNISGATILGTGEVCMVLNPQDLVHSVRRHSGVSATPMDLKLTTSNHRYSVLLVEDSIATRTQEKRILEAAGYEVVTAVDGLDGFQKLQTRSFDAVVTDVQMPHMSGLELTARIRQHREYNELPVVLVTTLASDEDRRRGADVGASAYITKGSFSQDMLLETLQRLI